MLNQEVPDRSVIHGIEAPGALASNRNGIASEQHAKML